MVQLWITIHLWRPRQEKLAKTAKYKNSTFLDKIQNSKYKIQNSNSKFNTKNSTFLQQINKVNNV